MKYLLFILLMFNQLLSFCQSNSEKMDIILVPQDAEYSCGEINGIVESLKALRIMKMGAMNLKLN